MTPVATQNSSSSQGLLGSLGTPATTRTAAPNLGQNDFLRLMTAQLTSQDPFKPLDNTQMVAQMAQFSQVTGITEMNANIAKIAASLGGNRFSESASWIGHNMLTESTLAAPLEDGSFAGEISLPEAADSVNLSLVDSKGQIVHSAKLGAQSAGEIPFAWDGRDADGNLVNRPVRIVVNALADGKAVPAGTAAWTHIGGIQSPASGADSRLVTGLGLIAPDAAIRLS